MYISYSFYFEVDEKQAEIIKNELDFVIPCFISYIDYKKEYLEMGRVSFNIEFDNKKDWEIFSKYLEEFPKRKF